MGVRDFFRHALGDAVCYVSVMLLAPTTCIAASQLPPDVVIALQEVFHPAERTGVRLTVIGKKLEQSLSGRLRNVLQIHSKQRECASIFVSQELHERDPRVDPSHAEKLLHAGISEEMYAETLSTDFRAFAHYLDHFAQAKRAVLYYVAAIQYHALAPNLLFANGHDSSLVTDLESLLVCADQNNGDIRSYAWGVLFDSPSKLSHREMVEMNIAQILIGIPGVDANLASEVATQLSTHSFAGKSFQSRSTFRLAIYHQLFRKRIDPLQPEILAAIYACEQLLGYEDPQPRN